MVSGVVGLLAMEWILYRQMRPAELSSSIKVGVIISAVGLYSAADYLDDTKVSTLNMALAIVSLAIGVGLAAVRGYTNRIYISKEGTVMTCGTMVTAGLWILSIAIHIGMDAIGDGNFGWSSLTLYIGLMILTQIAVLRYRALQLGHIADESVTGLFNR